MTAFEETLPKFNGTGYVLGAVDKPDKPVNQVVDIAE